MITDDFPEGSIDYQVIVTNPKDWVVEEYTTMFIAHPVSSEVHDCPCSVTWTDADERDARRWLHKEAVKDRTSLGECDTCSKPIYKKGALAPYCSEHCRDFEAQ